MSTIEVAGQRSQSSSTSKGYRFGISEFSTWPWSFDQDIAAYGTLGIDAVEVTQFKLTRPRYAEQLAQVTAAGMQVSSVQTTVHSFFKDSLVGEPPDPQHRLAYMKRSMTEIAPHVPQGTPFVVITGAAPSGDCQLALSFARGALLELAEHASALGVRVAFEALNPVLFHTDTALWSLADALSMVEDIGHPSLGLCVDTWNVWQTPDLHDVIRRAAERIFLVQVSDWRTPHADADRRCLGEGTLPLASMLATIRASGYSGPYVLEIFSTQSLSDSLWNGDMRAMLEKNVKSFDAVWRRSLESVDGSVHESVDGSP